MTKELKTQQQAVVLARDYNLVPYEPLKCERTVPEGVIRTLFFANSSNIVKILIKYDRDANSVAGTLSPIATGTYSFAGQHNDKNYYERPDKAWLIWWDGVDAWNISEALDIQGDNFWTRTDPVIEGEYSPGGNAQGTPTVEPPKF